MKRKSGKPTLVNESCVQDRGRSARPTLALRLRAVVICCGMVLLFAGMVAAKRKKPLTKTIQGEVLDQDNNPIVGASVELTDVTSGKTLGIYSEAGGRYQFTDLKPSDDYQVRATYKGQQSDVRHASALDDEGVKVLNLTISPAAPQ
jgi:Carboxypeptidase regulatory-like domain